MGAKSGMYGELPKLEIGQFSISKMSDKDGEPNVWIESEEGEGGEFPAEKLEAVIKDFFDKNF